MRKTIGIIGGMGALATADLFQKIVMLTAARDDREHIRVYMDNNTSIPDRTKALLHGGEDPVPYMTDSIKKLELCKADCLIMPCNTAHCFLPKLQPLTNIPFISMPQAAAQACQQRFNGKKIAILATDGTIQSNLYQDALTKVGVEYLIPDDEDQKRVMSVIYEGVKAGYGPEKYGKDWHTVIENMRTKGAECFLLGCTELPLAAQTAGLEYPSVDPTLELAIAAIKFCGYEVKQL